MAHCRDCTVLSLHEQIFVDAMHSASIVLEKSWFRIEKRLRVMKYHANLFKRNRMQTKTNIYQLEMKL